MHSFKYTVLTSCLIMSSLAYGYTAGTYVGEGQGNNGPIKVEVTVSDNKILDVKVLEHKETSGISDEAFKQIPSAIVNKQSLAIDAVSGASHSSAGLIAAATAALTKAGADVATLTKKSVRSDVATLPEKQLTTDVLVIGGGGTGLAAAASAAQQGVQVLLIEKLPQVGGSSALAGGAIAAAGSSFQKAIGVKDTKDEWLSYWIDDQKRSNHESVYPDEKRLSQLMDDANVTIEWLHDPIGHNYADPRPFGWGGPKRAHAPAEAPVPKSGRGSSAAGGRFVTAAIKAYLDKQPNVKVLTSTVGDSLIVKDGKVVGAKATSKDAKLTISAKAVILATGGYAHNAEMLAKRLPDYAPFADLSKATVGAMGDGIRMATAVGAVEYEDPWVIGLYVFPRDQKLTNTYTSVDKYKDRVFINQNGQRFINEDLPYLTVPIAEQKKAWAIVDSSDPKKAAQLEAAACTDEVSKGNTWEELAVAMKVDPATMAKTMNEYNEDARNKQDDRTFKKTSKYVKEFAQGPFYAVRVYPVTGGTLGGVKTNEKFQVLDKNGKVIPGLYAGGETANKIYFNRIYTSGAGLTIAYTSGRISGKQAGSEAKAK